MWSATFVSVFRTTVKTSYMVRTSQNSLEDYHYIDCGSNTTYHKMARQHQHQHHHLSSTITPATATAVGSPLLWEERRGFFFFLFTMDFFPNKTTSSKTPNGAFFEARAGKVTLSSWVFGKLEFSLDRPEGRDEWFVSHRCFLATAATFLTCIWSA